MLSTGRYDIFDRLDEMAGGNLRECTVTTLVHYTQITLLIHNIFTFLCGGTRTGG